MDRAVREQLQFAVGQSKRETRPVKLKAGLTLRLECRVA